MNITLSQKVSYNRLKADTLVVPLFKGEKEIAYALPASVKKLVASVIASKEFQCGTLETQVLHTGGNGVSRVCLLGLGEKKECTLDVVQRAYGTAIMRLKKAKAKSVALIVRGDAVQGKTYAEICARAVLGVRMAQYHFVAYKSKSKKEIAHIGRVVLMGDVSDDRATKSAYARAMALADALDFARDLGNTPPNHATPAYIADAVKALAAKIPGTTATIFDKARIVKEKMGGLLGVAQGSQHEPRFIIFDYKGHTCNDKSAPCRPIVLVGKAITFDTGGISLKPGKSMDEMKFDMCGGAAVIATVAAAARLRLPVHVVALVPAAENMPSHTAYKPSDVLTLLDGTTLEVLNTDAEGRVVLADGLLYAKKYQPKAIVDVATLTGAIVVALGDYAAGLFTPDNDCAAAFARIGEETGDRVWRMPLVKEWADTLKSTVADVRQVPTQRIADATIGGLFLQHFVDAKTSWAHLDIASTAWKTEGASYVEPGATGASVRLLVAWLEEISRGE